MADQLTGRRQHLAGVQGQLQEQRQTAQAIELQNIRDEREFSLEKRRNTLAYLEKINDARLARADAISDYQEAQMAADRALVLEEKKNTLRREFEEFKQPLELEKIDRRAAAQAANRAPEKEAQPGLSKTGADLAGKIEGLLQSPDITELHGRGFLKTGWRGLKPDVRAKVIEYSVELINSKDPQDKLRGAESYLRAHMDDKGRYQDVDMDSDAYGQMTQALIDLFGFEGGQEWLRQHGLVGGGD
jgi:hypothetical protein